MRLVAGRLDEGRVRGVKVERGWGTAISRETSA